LETQVRGLGFGFNQSVKSAWTADSNSLYFGKNNPMVGYTHKRAALTSLFGGDEPVISNVHEILAPGEQRMRSFSLEVPISATDVVIPDGADFEPYGVVKGRGKLADFRVLAFAWEAQHNNWTQSDFSPIVAIDEQPLWDLALNTNYVKSQADLALYPNPTANFVHVELMGGLINQWEIIDLSGRTLLSGQADRIQNLSLDVSSLSVGTYWLRCQTLGGQSLSQAFVKTSF
jgi:hypothetical protein